jgi:hypothetical protein
MIPTWMRCPADARNRSASAGSVVGSTSPLASAARSRSAAPCYGDRRMSDERAALERMRRGHRAAAARQRELTVQSGTDPAQAISEALSALALLQAMKLWPGPRDPASERAVVAVRRRWARIQRRARQDH